MSQINVNTIRNRTGGPPNLDKGAVVTGILTCTGNVSVGGTLTYEDVTNIDSTGIVTAKSGIKVGNPISPGIGATIDPNGNAVFAGIVTAAQFSGIDTDKISEGNTEVEAIDTGSDGHVKMTTEGSERLRVGPAGQIGLSGANYGTSGQLLTSSGNASAATWTTVSAAPTISAPAQGAIAVDKPLVLLGNGKVEQAQNFAPADTGKFDETVIDYMPGFDETTSTDYLDSNESLYPSGEFMADYDPVNGKIVAIRHNKTTYAPTLYVGTPSFDAGNNRTVTWDSGTAISGSFNSGDYGAVIRYNPHYKKFLVMWNKATGGSEGTNTCHVSLSGDTLTIGTVTKIDLVYNTGTAGRKFYNMMLTMCYEGLRNSIVITCRVGQNEGSNMRKHLTRAVNMSGDTPVFGANYFELIDHSNQQAYFIQPTYINQDAIYDPDIQRVCYFSSFTVYTTNNTWAHYLAAVSITVAVDFQIMRGNISTYEDHWNKSQNYDDRCYSARLAYHKDKKCCTAFWYKGSYTSQGSSQQSKVCAITYNSAGNGATRGTQLSFNQDEADGNHTLWGGDQCTMIGRDDGTSYWMARRSDYTTGSPAIWPRLGIKFTMSGATGSETVAVQFITNSWKPGGATALGTNGFSWWQSSGSDLNGGGYSTGEQCCGLDLGLHIWWIGASRGSVTSTDAAYQKRVIVHGGYFVGGGNLSSSNYIGFSDGAYSDGQTATVKVIGNVVNSTGLSTNTDYYVTNIGDVTTTDTNNTLVGKAFSHNKILIKN